MGILKKAINEQAFLKCGAYGEAGSGKTTTASHLAMAISHKLGNKKPIAFFETEAGSDFLVNRFEMEKIELLRVKSHSLADLLEAGKEAEASCSLLIVDSISHVWSEVLEAKLRAVNAVRKKKGQYAIPNLEFQHYNDVKREWAKWTTFFLNSKLHVIVCGRAGDIWERVVNEETGKKELQSAGTKMKAEKEFGYEPSLSIEMQRVARSNKPGAGWIHRATVLKDRSDTINGRQFDFEKPKAGYKAGDWKLVYKAFEPAILSLNLGAEHKTFDATRTAEELFPGQEGESRGADRAKQATVALEEIQGSIVSLFPGQDAKSKAMKVCLLQVLFNTRSWTAVESMKLEKLQHAARFLLSVEPVLKTMEFEDEAGFKTFIEKKLCDQIDEQEAKAADTVENDEIPANFGAQAN